MKIGMDHKTQSKDTHHIDSNGRQWTLKMIEGCGFTMDILLLPDAGASMSSETITIIYLNFQQPTLNKTIEDYF